MYRALQRIVKRFRRPEPPRRLLKITDGGLAAFQKNQELFRFRWMDVAKIETYKVDLFSVDMISLDFHVDAKGLVFSTDDEMTGFSELCNRLGDYFPSLPPDWWGKVAFPVFIANRRVLFDRSNNPASSK